MNTKEAIKILSDLADQYQHDADGARACQKTSISPLGKVSWGKDAEYNENRASALRLAVEALREKAKSEELTARLKGKPTQAEWDIPGPSVGDAQ